MRQRSATRLTRSCSIMLLGRLRDWQARSWSTSWKLIWSFASGTESRNSHVSAYRRIGVSAWAQPESSAATACVAHKSLTICERRRLKLFLSAIQRGWIDTENCGGFINCPGVSAHLPDVLVLDFFERDPAADAKLQPDLNDFRQIVSANLISASENHRSLDEISQFPQIAGPTVRSHRFKRSHGEAAKSFSCSVRKKIQMSPCNRLHVLEPLPH